MFFKVIGIVTSFRHGLEFVFERFAEGNNWLMGADDVTGDMLT
jgi:hypothetical protein